MSSYIDYVQKLADLLPYFQRTEHQHSIHKSSDSSNRHLTSSVVAIKMTPVAGPNSFQTALKWLHRDSNRVQLIFVVAWKRVWFGRRSSGYNDPSGTLLYVWCEEVYE